MVVLADLTVVDPAAAKEITGTPDDDWLTGTPTADRIRGLAGNDNITGDKGDDWLFGGEDDDNFDWVGGDGHDRIDGGVNNGLPDQLVITAGKRLRLHFDALDQGPEKTPKGALQVIGLKRVENIFTSATAADDWLRLRQTKERRSQNRSLPASVMTGSRRVQGSALRAHSEKS
jgi:Ca2+-binding RTX toxin-like protein